MGDLAVNIAVRAVYLSKGDPLSVALDFPQMAEGVRNMVRKSLDALTKVDSHQAGQVLTMDDEIDDANRRMFDILQEHMLHNPTTIKRAEQLLSASRHLERIADLATNIAEDVVYMAEGKLIRHLTENFSDPKNLSSDTKSKAPKN